MDARGVQNFIWKDFRNCFGKSALFEKTEKVFGFFYSIVKTGPKIAKIKMKL